MGKETWYLFERNGVFGWCSMGNASGSDMSIVSERMRSSYCKSIFPDHVSMEMAPACITETH